MNRFFTLLLAASCLTATSQVPDYVPTEGLVGWWAFEGNAHDQSGNGIDLLEVGSVEYVSDRLGNATSAIGIGGGATESRVQFPNFSLLDNWNQGTLSFWVNVVEHNVTGHYFGFDNMFCVRQRHGVNTQFMLGLFGGTTRVRIHLNGALPNSGDLVSEDALVVGQWHHVTMTFNGSEGFQHIYIDGQLSGSKASVAMISNMGAPDMLAFGFYGGVGSGSCNSLMDEIGLWNRALDALEVESLFATLVPVTGCVDAIACNFDVEATVDDGSCIPSGCMDAEACNYVAEAGCDDGSCDYTCCPGPGCCSVGHYWDWEVGKCFDINPGDINLDGCVQLNDLLDLLSAYGDCGAEESAWQCGDPLEYQGYDYETVQIGEQCWFAENLRAENYNNGDAIPADLDDGEWFSTTNGAMSVYGSGESDCTHHSPEMNACDDQASILEFGRLYNGYSVVDERGLCPSNWRVSSDSDWSLLEVFLGMSELESALTGWRGTNQGLQLKSTNAWANNGNGDGTTEFNGMPSGFRHDSGWFGLAGGNGWWWTSTLNEEVAFYRKMNESRSELYRATYNLRVGFSVRCIKDAE